MSELDKFDKWLRREAESADVRDLVAKREAEPPVSEELLAEYYAGALSLEEERLVARRAVVSSESSAFLAQLDADVEAAAADLAPPPAFLAHLRASVAKIIRGIATPQPAWRLAASVSALVLMVVAGSRLLDRPPDEFGPAYQIGSRRGPEGGTVELPGGARISLVDPGWPLRTPTRKATRIRWFSWDPVRNAGAYQFELRDASGAVLYSRDGIERNVLRLPWTVRRKLTTGHEYIWVVTAVDRASTPVVRGVGRFQLDR